jgi:hypothetical protein
MRPALASLLLFLTACTSVPPSPPTGDGGTPDGGLPGGGSAEPISAPEARWTWVPFSDTQCGNGTPAGIGINPAPGGSQQVVLYLNGGGACWDAFTCYVLKSSAHVEDTYSQAVLDTEVAFLTSAGMTDRQDATNPFRGAHFVFVPYCTGDLHAGDAVQSYDTFNPQRKLHHRGARNMSAFLTRLRATFPDAQQIWLMGSSAGGYGAQLHFERISQAFPDARVDLLADSAQVVMPYGGRLAEMSRPWNLQFPAECTECAQRFPALIDTLATRWPGRRFGLLAYDDDATLTLYFNFPLGEMRNATNTLLANQYTRPNTRYFVLTGNQHVLLGNLKSLVGPGSVTLKDWVRQWATRDPEWSNAR